MYSLVSQHEIFHQVILFFQNISPFLIGFNAQANCSCKQLSLTKFGRFRVAIIISDINRNDIN